MRRSIDARCFGKRARGLSPHLVFPRKRTLRSRFAPAASREIAPPQSAPSASRASAPPQVASTADRGRTAERTEAAPVSIGHRSRACWHRSPSGADRASRTSHNLICKQPRPRSPRPLHLQRLRWSRRPSRRRLTRPLQLEQPEPPAATSSSVLNEVLPTVPDKIQKRFRAASTSRVRRAWSILGRVIAPDG